MRRSLIAAGLVLALGACMGPSGDDTATDSDAPAAPAVEAPTGPNAPALPEASVVLSPDSDLSVLQVPEYLTASRGEDGALVITGVDEERRAGGTTSGVAVEIDEVREAAISGQSITVSVVGKAADGDRAGVRAAFSTNEVGHSGWRSLRFGPEYTVSSFTYDVPVMETGRGDFIGFIPDDGTVNILSVGVEITPVEAEPAE